MNIIRHIFEAKLDLPFSKRKIKLNKIGYSKTYAYNMKVLGLPLFVCDTQKCYIAYKNNIYYPYEKYMDEIWSYEDATVHKCKDNSNYLKENKFAVVRRKDCDENGYILPSAKTIY